MVNKNQSPKYRKGILGALKFLSVEMTASSMAFVGTQGIFLGQASLDDRITRRIGLVDDRSILGFGYFCG